MQDPAVSLLSWLKWILTECRQWRGPQWAMAPQHRKQMTRLLPAMPTHQAWTGILLDSHLDSSPLKGLAHSLVMSTLHKLAKVTIHLQLQVPHKALLELLVSCALRRLATQTEQCTDIPTQAAPAPGLPLRCSAENYGAVSCCALKPSVAKAVTPSLLRILRMSGPVNAACPFCMMVALHVLQGQMRCHTQSLASAG